MLYNLTPSRELTQPWCESLHWVDSDQHAAYIQSRTSTHAVLPYVCWYSFYLPTEGSRAESIPSQVELGVGIEPKPCNMMVHCSTNWAFLADFNRAIICKHCKAPILEEVAHQLGGSTTYSKLNAKNGFWSTHLTHRKAHPLTTCELIGKVWLSAVRSLKLSSFEPS